VNGSTRTAGRTSPRRATRSLGGAALTLSAVAALTALVLHGCRDASSPALRPLRIAVHSEPLALDPHLRNEQLTFGTLSNVFDALTRFDARSKVGPALAVQWENPDDLTWIFHLRPYVKFHDGRALGADDVVFSLRRARTLAGSDVTSYVVAVAEARAIDPLTVEIKTTRPYPLLLNKLAFVLIVPSGSPDVIREPVGTGAYRLVPSAPGVAVTLEAFADFWGGQAAEPAVELIAEPNAERRVERLIAGDVDVAQELSADLLPRVEQSAGCKVLRQDSLEVAYLSLRIGEAPLADLRVRQAIDLALDRQALVDRLLGGHGSPLGQVAGRNIVGSDPDIGVTARDLPRARALLAAAGFPSGLDLEMETRPGRHADAEALAAQLAGAGIRLRTRELAWTDLYPRLLAGEVGIYLGGIICATADASDFFDAKAHSRQPERGYGTSNFSRYSNPVLDRLIEDSNNTFDLLDRRKRLQACMRLAMADLAYIPLYTASQLYGVRAGVEWRPRNDGFILARDIRRRGVTAKARDPLGRTERRPEL